MTCIYIKKKNSNSVYFINQFIKSLFNIRAYRFLRERSRVIQVENLLKTVRTYIIIKIYYHTERM